MIRKIIMNESILDPINKTRCRAIFDENDVMLPEAKAFIENTFKTWYDQLNPDKKFFDLLGYKLIGSSSGFQYTDSQDVDIQAVIKLHEGKTQEDLRKLLRILPNGNYLPGTNKVVNFFFSDVDNPVAEYKVENLYNITTGEWEKKVDNPRVKIPLLYVREIQRFFTDGFDLLFGRYARDKAYLQDTLKLDPETQEISQKEKDEALDRAIEQFKEDIDSLRIAAQLLYGFLLKAYDDNNFFHVQIQYSNDDPRYSMNNLIYKALDKFEYRERSWEMINEGRKILRQIEKERSDNDN